MEKETTTTEVPKQFACPVCGKWGRKNHGLNSIPFGYLYCNPKARRGGKGCGEIFKHLKPSCIQIIAKIGGSKTEIVERKVLMGLRMIQMMQEANRHHPFQRKTRNSNIHNLLKPIDGNCACGCGLEVVGSRRFANNDCAMVVYDTAHMIANQSKMLTRFLIQLRGNRCECCKVESEKLEIDHIIEVINGGGLCWIDNFQLLCRRCHAEKTAKLAAERASDRKQVKQATTGQLSIF